MKKKVFSCFLSQCNLVNSIIFHDVRLQRRNLQRGYSQPVVAQYLLYQKELHEDLYLFYHFSKEGQFLIENVTP